MNVRRFASLSGAVVAGAIAAYASYRHSYHLAETHKQGKDVSILFPLSVDSMMVVATLALRDGRKHRQSAWFAFWLGIAATITANMLATTGDWVSHAISVWPAVAFIAVVEVIVRRTPPTIDAEPESVAAPEPIVAAATLPTPPPVTAVAEPEPVPAIAPATREHGWDKVKAIEMLSKRERAEVVANAVGTGKRTIERWRNRWVQEGKLNVVDLATEE